MRKSFYSEVLQFFLQRHDGDDVKLVADDVAGGHSGLKPNFVLAQEDIARVRIQGHCTSRLQPADTTSEHFLRWGFAIFQI